MANWQKMITGITACNIKLIEAREELADATVSQSDWRGDECGYLAAQCKARTLRGLKPTADQAEAWLVCNTNAVKLFEGAI